MGKKIQHTKISLLRKLIRNTMRVNKCREWQGSKNAGGYGVIVIDKKSHLVHRIVWLITRGNSDIFHLSEIPKGFFVCHHCDNPSCIEPTHLFLGTPLDNMVDMWEKRRNYRPQKNFYEARISLLKQTIFDLGGEMMI